MHECITVVGRVIDGQQYPATYFEVFYTAGVMPKTT